MVFDPALAGNGLPIVLLEAGLVAAGRATLVLAFFAGAAFLTGAAFLAGAFFATAFLAGAAFLTGAFLATAFFAGAAFWQWLSSQRV